MSPAGQADPNARRLAVMQYRQSANYANARELNSAAVEKFEQLAESRRKITVEDRQGKFNRRLFEQ